MRSDVKVTTAHNAIQKWAEERGGKPALIKDTRQDGEIALLRIHFPNYNSENALAEISWQEFFTHFDEQKLAFQYQEHISSGEKSHLFQLIRRDTYRTPVESKFPFLAVHEDKVVESKEEAKITENPKTHEVKKSEKETKETKNVSSKMQQKSDEKTHNHTTAKKSRKETHK